MRVYYDRRAQEYDDVWLGQGLYADRDRPGWEEEVGVLTRLVAALPAVRTLDVACGTGFLTRHLRGDVVGVDQSERMLRLARVRPEGIEPARWEQHVLRDGSTWAVYKRYFTGLELADELADGEVLHEGRYFVVVRA